MPVQGLDLITPTSVAVTGSASSASILTNGSVSFNNMATLELRGVFSSNYDNYQMVVNIMSATVATYIDMRYMSGTAQTTNANYDYQEVSVNGTLAIGLRTNTATSSLFGYVSSSQHNGFTAFIFNPYAVSHTSMRTLGVDTTNDARIYDFASTYQSSTSLDGIKFGATNGLLQGYVRVYGMAK